MIDYTLIKARPTRYRGIMFRSQLEATWAAFFDQLKWQWEYEPFELNGWVPDFLIKGVGQDVLVEIKPVDRTDEDTQVKITQASEGHDCYLMIGGRQPVFDGCGGLLVTASMWTSCSCCNRCRWTSRAIVQIEDNGYDFCFDHYPSGFFKTGLRRRLCKVDELMGGEVFDLWARAKNATQWRPHGWRA